MRDLRLWLSSLPHCCAKRSHGILREISIDNLAQFEHDKRPLSRMTARKLARHLQCDYRTAVLRWRA